MLTLTKRQREILDFVTDFIGGHGYAPSLQEIADHFGLSSVATVHAHLSRLAEKGLIERGLNQRRSLRIVDPADSVDWRTVELPLLGRIAAGRPIEAVLDNETIAVPRDMVRGKRTFVLKVKGDSMIDDNIQDGDYIIIEESHTAENADTVVALVDEEKATLKRFHRERDHIRLQPANESVKPIRVEPHRLRIQGKVIGLIRRYLP